jgi:geranylgeranyl reductase family protein
MNRFDVIIVGGGPAGSACATVLASSGLSVLVCERAKFPRDKICGDCINPRAWQLFAHLGIDAQLRCTPSHLIRGVRITNLQGKQVSATYRPQAEAPFFAMKRQVLDDVLLRRAKRAGATIAELTDVRDVVRTAGKWHVRTSSAALPNDKVYVSDFIIGADGRNSVVARKIGTPKGRKRKSVGNRVGIQWLTDYQANVQGFVELFLTPHGYFGVTNVDNHHANLAMVTSNAMARLLRNDFDLFMANNIYANRGARERFAHLHPTGGIASAFPIQPDVRQVFDATALLVGDARQTVEPFTGEGTYFALRDGLSGAQALLRRFYPGKDCATLQRSSRFWANRIYSPVLQNRSLANRLVSLGARFPRATHLAFRSLVHA